MNQEPEAYKELDGTSYDGLEGINNTRHTAMIHATTFQIGLLTRCF